MGLKDRASELIRQFKGDSYSFGTDKLEMAGSYAGEFGKRVLLIGNTGHLKSVFEKIHKDLLKKGLVICGKKIVPGSQPNSPREDVYRIATYMFLYRPDCLMAVGGGSTLDAVKAANVLYSLGLGSLEIDDYLGTGKVTEKLKRRGASMLPLIAVQTNSSSGSHLTKYANITDPVTGQKKLIVDNAVIPDRAVFDYGVTESIPTPVSLDGAMDGISHCLEVFYGAKGENLEKIREVALTGIELIVEAAPRLLKNPTDKTLCELLGLGTDLGGYAIMLGGTNGGHLTSFSLVDVTSHGRACGLMNPYYTVFFAPAITEQLLAIADIFKRHGYITENLTSLKGRELGETVAKGLMSFARAIGFPTTLAELDGFSDGHVKRALDAARDPQLKMKLENMPVPLSTDQIDKYMGPVLEAARTGDLFLIKSMG